MDYNSGISAAERRGMQRGIQLVINNILKEGYTLDEIQEITGITETQIKELQEKAKQKGKAEQINKKKKAEQIGEILENLKENKVQKGNFKKNDTLKWLKQLDEKPDPAKVMKENLKKNNTKKNTIKVIS